MTDLAARRAATHQSFYSLFPMHPVAPGIVASVVSAAPTRSLFNAVTYLGDAAASVPELLEPLADGYAAAGVQAWTVWVQPGDGELLRPPLERAGHRLDGTPEAMGAVLAELDLDGPDAGGPGRWDEMVEVNAAAYDVPVAELDPMRLASALRLYRTDAGGVVLGIHDHEGDAGVTFVAARPEARGRGLVAALLRQALRDARERGCTTTTLEATKLGRPVYERVGFRPLGALEMWERRTTATSG